MKPFDPAKEAATASTAVAAKPAKRKNVPSKNKAKPAKTPKPTSPPTQSAALEALNEQRKLVDALEEIAAAKESHDSPFYPEELALFRKAGFPEKRDAEQYVGRVLRAHKRLVEAGKPKEFDDATDRLEEAQAVAAEKCPKIEAAIAKLQAELAEITNEAVDAQQSLDKMNTAREHLRKLAPPNCHEDVTLSRGCINRQFVPRIGKLENQVRLAENLQGVEHNSEKARLHAGGLPFDHPARPRLVNVYTSRDVRRDMNDDFSHGTLAVDEVAWNQYLADLLAAKPQAEIELAELVDAKQAAIDESKEPLNYYLQKAGLL